ncbi:molybdate ABC transporter substrate-binding protein [Sulfurimonas sp. HSL3-7]|uniref:molybdate ABC transporter substrate-binding protein n=1 Tax=Sulfonitrofixus jiaomeiensis TaxID=3131938 RepID=UPI0031F7E840
MRRLLFLFTLAGTLLYAEQKIKIAAAAGYKKPLQEVIKAYRQEGGSPVKAIFGNVRQISVQAKHTDIALLIGDRNYLSDQSGLAFDGFTSLGSGKLVLAYPKNTALTACSDLAQERVRAIAIAKPSKAIYGIAAETFLQRSGLYETVKERLRIVATVPQVTAYLVANEVDAGLINLTAALANEKKLGGYLVIPQQYYEKIDIVAGTLPECSRSRDCQTFLDYLRGERAREIFKKYGL